MTEDRDLSSLYADSAGQTADMHPAEIMPEAEALTCVDHPDETSFTVGFGYAGGGFGSYRRCGVCRRVYNKTAAKL